MEEVPLLQTKLYIPPIRPEVVLRARLIERLNAGVSRKLTVVSAPAGFGKTTLVGEWVQKVRVRQNRAYPKEATLPIAAWLSLDESDNDPALFLAYLLAARRCIEPEIGKRALEALERSDYRFLFDGVDRLSDEKMSPPWLIVYHCWALHSTGQVATVGLRLEDTAWALDCVQEHAETKRQEMLGLIAGLKAQYALWQRDYPNLLDFANPARAHLPSDNRMRGFCANMRGAAFWVHGDLAPSKDAFAEAAALGKASGNARREMSGTCSLGHSLELEGRLQRARRLYQDTLRLAERGGRLCPVAGYIHNELTKTLYEFNELDLASQHLADGIKLRQRVPDGRAVSFSYCLLNTIKSHTHSIYGRLNVHSRTQAIARSQALGL